MNHTSLCRTLLHSDAAKRIADEYAMHRIALGYEAIGHWLAFSMHDGTSDHTLYDSKYAAVAHQHHNESTMVFIQITPSGMPVCDAEVLLSVQRKIHDAGVRLVDPDHKQGGRERIRRSTVEDERANLRTILSGGRSAPSNLVFPKDQ